MPSTPPAPRPRPSSLGALAAGLLLIAAAGPPPPAAPPGGAGQVAAGDPQTAAGELSAADLRLPADAYPGIAEVVTRALAVDDGAPDAETPPEVRALRQLGQASAANYRYVFDGDGAGQLRARLDVFPEAAEAAAHFGSRHLPEMLALTEPLDAGDEGFVYRDEYAGFRVGPVVVEIRAAGAATEHLRPFARLYAGFVAARLRGEGLPGGDATVRP